MGAQQTKPTEAVAPVREAEQPLASDVTTMPVDTGRYPKHVTSTYTADGLEAYVEVLQAAHGQWHEEPATLVTLAIVHLNSSTVQSSTVSLTFSHLPLSESDKAVSAATSPPSTSLGPTVLLHAPSFLRRAVGRQGQHGWLTCGVFAPPLRVGKEQEVIVKLEDSLLVGLQDRFVVRLVVANNGLPFLIKAVVRPKSADGSQLERRDEGPGAIVDPALGPRAQLCTSCSRKQPASNDGETALLCDRLDHAHVPDRMWTQLAERDAHKWPDRDLVGGDGVSL